MVPELKEVFSKVEALKEDEQREIAKLLEQEMKWDDTLSKTQDVLGKLADEALQAFKTGNTTQSDW